jgi:hypothetical protein
MSEFQACAWQVRNWVCFRKAGYRLREAMFVALPRKVDTMLPRAAERTLPRANLARIEPNQSGRGISMCCAVSVETVLWHSGVPFAAKWRTDQQPHAAAALRCWTRTRLLSINKRKSLPRTNICAQSIPGFRDRCSVSLQIYEYLMSNFSKYLKWNKN